MNIFTACRSCLSKRTNEHLIRFYISIPETYFISFSILYWAAVGWSRVYEGQHSWMDIVDGISVADSIAKVLVFKQKNVIFGDNEQARQIVHTFQYVCFYS
jgi:hypothetical protein